LFETLIEVFLSKPRQITRYTSLSCLNLTFVVEMIGKAASGRLRQPAGIVGGSRIAAGRKGNKDAIAMLNIPTDLLRTLIAVVDLRSFTKAAKSLGVTQPAVSAQIKRLQSMLGCELLDKRSPGVSLSPRGEAVVNQARKLLSVNDEILQSTGGRASKTLRVGIPSDYAGSKIPEKLARFRLRWPAVNFIVTSGSSEHLLRDLGQGDLDVVMAVTETLPAISPRHVWRREAIWVHSQATRIGPEGPVPLVCYGEDCACQRVAVAALRQAGRTCEFVFTSHSLVSLAAAVAAGFGVMVIPRGRAMRHDLAVWEDAPLPPLPDLYCGIYVREGGTWEAIAELADYLNELRFEPVSPDEASMGRAVSPIRASKVN
jgi:DNA-binding transcriptional LysR family regulator